jgi:antitoxin component HigA of HigAB toxin-antitoxin module
MAMTKTRKPRTADRYLELVGAFPLRPIRTDVSHQQAKHMLRSLARDRSAAAADYKAVLVSLIASYEREAGQRLDTSKLTAANVVRHLLAERSMSVNAFAAEVGVAQSALSDMLNGKRDWSKSAIVNISNYFGLRPEIFLR